MLDSAGNNLDLGENAKENISEDMLLELQRSNCRSNKHSRRSSIQFRGNYCNCLCREAYLNDDIISFWLLWILCREHPDFSCIYPLESHFYSSMSDEVSGIGNCLEKYLHLDFKWSNVCTQWHAVIPVGQVKLCYLRWTVGWIDIGHMLQKTLPCMAALHGCLWGDVDGMFIDDIICVVHDGARPLFLLGYDPRRRKFEQRMMPDRRVG